MQYEKNQDCVFLSSSVFVFLPQHDLLTFLVPLGGGIKCHLSYMHIRVHLSNNPCILVFQLQPDLLCSHLLGPSYGDGWMLLPDEQVSF